MTPPTTEITKQADSVLSRVEDLFIILRRQRYPTYARHDPIPEAAVQSLRERALVIALLEVRA